MPVFMRFLLLLLGFGILPGAHAAACLWQPATLQFAGSPIEQARCLLRPIAQGGDVSAEIGKLPASLEAIVGETVQIDKSRLRDYLREHSVNETSIGGKLEAPLSKTAKTDLPVLYFVIHDTSTLYQCARIEFPAITDSPQDDWNLPGKYLTVEEGHLYLTRDGQSYQPQQRTLGTPWIATQLEHSAGKDLVRGRFLHIENVQLRRPDVKPGDPLFKKNSDECVNDRIAQQPGFSSRQGERLALVYIAASLRAGRWLIPAFHGVLDLGVGDHDDPQHFDLVGWAAQVCRMRDELGDRCVASD